MLKGAFSFDTISVLLSLAVCYLVLVKGILSEIISTKSVKRQYMEGYVTNERLEWQHYVRSTSHCVAECNKDSRCVSVFFNNITQKCEGHSVTFGLLNQNAVPKFGSNYYVLEKGKFYIGDSCSSTSDCVTTNAECRYNQCLCRPGYSFSPSEQVCRVDGCAVYGDYYTPVHNHYIIHSNQEVFSQISQTDCLAVCSNRTTYTCVSVEYKGADQECLTQSITCLDVPNLWKHDYSLIHNVTYFQRECQ